MNQKSGDFSYTEEKGNEGVVDELLKSILLDNSGQSNQIICSFPQGII